MHTNDENEKKKHVDLINILILIAGYRSIIVNRKNISPVADIDGSLITNPDDVVKYWGQYFEQLFKNDDENFKKHVTAKISQLSNVNQIKEHEVLEKVIIIKENEIRNVCSKLKNGKAGGKDGLKK